VLSVTASPGPIPGSYWVEPGRFCAGRYPDGRIELNAICAAGAESFLDLTEADEYGVPSYDRELEAGVEYRRIAIADYSVPAPDAMREILDALDGSLARGRTVYLHCLGGRGRTGTVVGCWLVRHGLDGAAAIEQIAGWRGDRASPETDEQLGLVLRWTTLDPPRR
jgi:hypothetical protein